MKLLAPSKHLVLLIISFILCQFCVAQNQHCLTFNGDDNYVEAENMALNEIGQGDFTVEAWIKGFENDQRYHPMIFSNRPNSSEGMLFFFHAIWGDSQYKMLCVQLNGMNYSLIDNGTFNGSLLDGAYHHVAVTKSNSLLQFYIDGHYTGERHLSSTTTVSSSSSTFLIGKDLATNNTFNGNIGDVRIWNYERSEFIIRSEMHSTDIQNITGLLGHWELNEGVGQLAFDKSTKAHGILGNSLFIDENDPTWEDGCLKSVSSGIESNAFVQLDVYPNPASDNISLNIPQNHDNFTINITNVFGQVVFSEQYYQTKEFNINIQDFDNGYYYIQVSSNGSTQKLKASFAKVN
ncbi:MAG: hypothetical protein ACJAUV_000755 [Flavobacteriales bacterium]|jgi:hypothetical protein